MKKIIAILFIFILFHAGIISTAKAQEILPRHEFSVSYGNLSIVELMEGVYGGEDGYNSRPIKSYSGAFSFTYRYVLSPRFSIGLACGYENENGDMREFVSSTNNGPVTSLEGTFKRNVFTVAPEILFHYLHEQNRPVSIYAYLGIGESYLNELDVLSPDYYNKYYYNGVNSLGNNLETLNNHTEITVQICPVGFSFGGKIRGFAELGFGYKGIFNGGLSLKL